MLGKVSGSSLSICPLPICHQLVAKGSCPLSVHLLQTVTSTNLAHNVLLLRVATLIRPLLHLDCESPHHSRSNLSTDSLSVCLSVSNPSNQEETLRIQQHKASKQLITFNLVSLFGIHPRDTGEESRFIGALCLCTVIVIFVLSNRPFALHQNPAITDRQQKPSHHTSRQNKLSWNLASCW